MAEDIQAKLRPFKWKGVEVPTSRLGFRLRHDLVQHKYPSRPGAKIEGTGRAPMEFTADIPIDNGIEPGAGEGWAQPLYPDVFRAFLTVCANGATGTLDHPEYGPILCKLDVIEGEWVASEGRSGIVLRGAWIETIEQDDTFATQLSKTSPAARLDIEAARADAMIDAYIADLGARNASIEAETRAELEAFKAGKMDPYTFGDFMRQLKAPIDQVALSSQSIAGSVDAIAYRASELSDSVDRARSPAVFYPLQDAADRMSDLAIDVKNDLAAQGQPVISVYTTPAEMTLDDVARITKSDFTQVLRLNAKLASAPSVPAHTDVRYPG